MEKGERRVSPFLVPMMMANAVRRVDLAALRLPGAVRDDLHGLRGLHPRHRLRRPADRLGPVRRRGHRRRRVGRHHHRAGRLRQHDRAVHHRRQQALRRHPRRLRARRGGRHDACSRPGTGPWSGAPPSSARCWARAARPTPTTSPPRRPAGSGAVACIELALADAGLHPGRHPPDQRPRHLDAAQRRGRGRGRRARSSARPGRR